MEVKYTISNGTPNYVAKLSGSSHVYTNTHVAMGTYSFTSVADGIYRLTVIDSLNCDVDYGVLSINNNAFIFSSILNGVVIESDIISGVTITSKTCDYDVTIIPDVATGVTMTIYFPYSLITLETPQSTTGNTYSISSVNISKNGTNVFFVSANSSDYLISGDTKTGVAIVDNIVTGDVIKVLGSIINHEESGQNASGFFSMTVGSILLNGNPFPQISTGFNVNNNLA